MHPEEIRSSGRSFVRESSAPGLNVMARGKDPESAIREAEAAQ